MRDPRLASRGLASPRRADPVRDRDLAHRDPRDDPQADRLTDEVLSRRALNRALLERQLLLRHSSLPVRDALEHLVGMQAQEIMPPYYGLWSRLEGFDPHELGRLLLERKAVRLWLMRGTIHLVTVEDALALKPLTQVVAERQHGGAFGRRMGGADAAELAKAARTLVEAEPLGARELGRRLVDRGFGQDVDAIGNAARAYLPLVQVTPRGVWGRTGRATLTTIESWTGRKLDAEPSIDELVLRYLRAFGPASVMDVQNWSGLTRLREVVERLRPRLVSFRDEGGKELLDLPDAPRPDADVPAPVRLLGEYDNVLLGHADRRRIIPEGFPWAAMLASGRFVNNLLVDGVLRATWWIERNGKTTAILGIRPHGRLTKAERTEVEGEARRMLDFAAAEAERRDVRFEEPVG
ncbi:MAG TPA: winged helix DNA-binding domain-containing protein [Gaiellaceae bacterium]